MIIYVTTKTGGVYTVDKKAAEAIIYNTAPWVPATHNYAGAMIRTWDIEAIQGGDADGKKALAELSKEYVIDCGYPFVTRE